MNKKITSLASRIKEDPRFEWVLLLLIIVFGSALRLYKLGEWSFWIDEIFTINHARAHFSDLETLVRNIPPNRNWFPISTILLGQLLNKSVVTEFASRLPALIFGILSIPLFFLLIKRVYSSGPALIAVSLLALSPWHLQWSQNARGYTSLLLFFYLALFAFYWGLEKNKPGYILLFFILTYLSVSERLVALLIFPVILVYLIVLKWLKFDLPAGYNARFFSILGLPIIGVGVIELVNYLINRTSRLVDIGSEIADTFVGLSLENPLSQAVFIAFSIGIPVLVFGFFSGIYFVRQKSRPGLLLFSAASIPFFLVIVATPFMFTEERYAFVALPGFLILCALGLQAAMKNVQSANKLLILGILAVIFLDMAGTNLMYFRVNNGFHRDWKGAYELVDKNLLEADRIISTWPELGAYYTGQEVLSWQDMNKDLVEQSGTRTWFVIVPDMAWYWGNEDFYWWVSHRTQLVDVFYLRTPDDMKIEVYLYDPVLNISIID